MDLVPAEQISNPPWRRGDVFGYTFDSLRNTVRKPFGKLFTPLATFKRLYVLATQIRDAVYFRLDDRLKFSRENKNRLARKLFSSGLIGIILDEFQNRSLIFERVD